MLEIKNLKTKISFKFSSQRISNYIHKFLKEKNHIFLMFLFLGLIGCYGYLFYIYVYQPEWSEARKQSYLDSKKEENIVFDKKRFEKVVQEIENREGYFQKSVENVPDIFSLK